MLEIFYVKGADDKYYAEIQSPGGGDCDYVPAEPGLTFRELGSSGKYIAVRSEGEAARQGVGSSHEAFFKLLPTDPKESRRALKRQDALQRQLSQLVIDRVMPGAHPDVRVIKDNEFLRLQEEYSKAVAKREERQSEFQPLNAYVHKLITKSGRVVRPILAGEVGMIGGQILRLEPGYGEGTQVQGGLDGVSGGQRDGEQYGGTELQSGVGAESGEGTVPGADGDYESSESGSSEGVSTDGPGEPGGHES